MEGVRVSQEWDEVVHEVQLMIEQLKAFCGDLQAAANGGKLTEDQCEIVNDITAMSNLWRIRLIVLNLKAASETAEEGETQE